MGDVIDLLPLVRRKRAASCQHAMVSVDDEAASATCDACGVEIDPWSMLRRIAARHDELERFYEREREIITADLAQKVADGNRTIDRLNAEVRELTDRKNRLWNERIDGRPLGAHPKTRARKPKSEAP